MTSCDLLSDDLPDFQLFLSGLILSMFTTVHV